MDLNHNEDYPREQMRSKNNKNVWFMIKVDIKTVSELIFSKKINLNFG